MIMLGVVFIVHYSYSLLVTCILLVFSLGNVLVDNKSFVIDLYLIFFELFPPQPRNFSHLSSPRFPWEDLKYW